MERTDMFAGAREIVPAIPPNVAFGILFGAAAVEVGFSPTQATAMSLFIFAGTAQMAAVELLRTDAALSVVLATVLVLNLRYVIYSASLAPKVANLSSKWRALMGYALSDINYALAYFKFSEAETSNRDQGVHKGWYYVGLTAPFVISFVLATLIGGLLGAAIGAELNLEFIIPLIFIALVVPRIETRTEVLVAGVAGIIAIVAVGVPFNLGLIIATVAGVAVGLAYENRSMSAVISQ